MALKWAYNKKTCHFCRGDSEFYNHPIRRYTCLDKYHYQNCEAFKLIDKHLRTCPICKPIYNSLDLCDKYAYDRYKCYIFKYTLRLARKAPLGNTKIKSDIQRGAVICEICNERVAKHTVGENRPCCEDKVKKCPGYHKYISNIHKQKYIDKPELKVQMSESMKIAQNKHGVGEAKRLAMLHLHNDPCTKCKEFQDNFSKAQKKRRGPTYSKFKIYHKRIDSYADSD